MNSAVPAKQMQIKNNLQNENIFYNIRNHINNLTNNTDCY